MKVFIVYGYDDYYPEPAHDQIKMITESRLKATLCATELKLKNEYDHVKVCTREVY